MAGVDPQNETDKMALVRQAAGNRVASGNILLFFLSSALSAKTRSVAKLPVHVLIHVPHEGPVALAQDDIETSCLHQILANPWLIWLP